VVNDSISAISPAWPTRWPKDSFKSLWTWLLAGFMASLFIATSILSLTVQTPKNVSAFDVDILILLQFAFESALVAVVLAALPSLSKFSLRELGFRVPSLATVGIAVIGAIAMIIVANGSASLIGYLAHSQHQQDIVQIFKEIHNRSTIILFAAFAILFVPFAEETLFRIFFFNLGMRYGGFWLGAVISGVLFGMAHGDVYAALPLALGGIILCAVYYRTRNAFASMITHALFNSLSIVLLLVAPKLTQ
jgi:membrane protease YdiL (CAAX protease family)